ncbi:kinase-like protein [Xylona heveae TC161]|uniref:Kinase-like protein n=1 Tax=Xylona heveae (strain CBS 132557 / TC161) TaxID=1328760 RepID=A0A165AK62_XYLHT|nr:kinase-like protein [Xylona heveae TC161]KZF20617.1 kinase-like protein [Xylona heveae TC161]
MLKHDETSCSDNSGRLGRRGKRAAIYRIILPQIVKLIRRRQGYHLAPRVLRLGRGRIIKYGSAAILAEAQALDYVSRNTSIPVPETITAFQSQEGITYILMKRCPGIPLCNAFSKLSVVEKQNILQQLRGYMNELRALKPPKPGQVGSACYGLLEDERIQTSPCGPFDSVADFHRALRGGITGPIGHEECDHMIAAQDRRDYEIKFTHGDLSFRNIIYNDGKITGIVDWESAGWFPDYWEYTMTWDSFWDNRELRDEIPAFLDPFPAELEMERTRWRLFVGW